jgi:hypothetical protein
MSKVGHPAYSADDPDDRLLWRFPYRRLEAEVIRDAMLAASGQLNRSMYGPSIYPEIPREALEAHSDPDKIWKPFDERASARRTIYAMVKRSLVVPMLEVLDVCDTARSAARRNVTVIAPQALTLLNGAFVNRQARHLAERIQRECGADVGRQVDRAYQLALGRPAMESERRSMARFVAQEAQELAESNAASEKSADGQAVEALARACRVIFNLNEFVYPD